MKEFIELVLISLERDNLIKLGSILFLLSFCHFVVDWGFQSHKEAMNKATNHNIRFVHCCVYTIGMLPLVALLIGDHTRIGQAVLTCASVMWISHFLIDTYIPVYLWVKYIRRPPSKDVTELEYFKDFASTPIGLFLVIAMDQVFHLLFLIPVALTIMWPTFYYYWGLVSGFFVLLLCWSVVFGVKKLYAIQENR